MNPNLACTHLTWVKVCGNKHVGLMQRANNYGGEKSL